MAIVETALVGATLVPEIAYADVYAAGSGAVATFTGHVRGDASKDYGQVKALFLEHHPVLAAAQLQHVAHVAAARWSLSHVVVLHRIGHVAQGAAIICIATSAAHRANALESCAFVIDQCKTGIALWKQEIFSNGATRWVGPRNSDHERTAAWTPGEILTI